MTVTAEQGDWTGVTLADESGWKLSTTSAAAALMRWLDLVLSDFAYADLLDWLQSPFTLSAQARKAELCAAIGAALRAEGVFAGLAPVIDPVTKLPFPNNQIPTARFDSVSVAVLALVPTPAGSSLSNNFNTIENENAHSTHAHLACTRCAGASRHGLGGSGGARHIAQRR